MRKHSRRANGLGSVYKLPGKRAKPWAARITRGYDDEGRQIKQLIGTYKTSAEAQRALALYDPTLTEPERKDITLKELFREWQTMPAYTRLDRSTQGNYTSVFDKYMFPFHDARFADLRLPEFQRMVGIAQQMGRSRSTQEKIKALGVILGKYAYSLDITSKVYATSVILPRTEKRTPEIFTPSEIDRLFQAAEDGMPDADTICILLYTGLRINELLHLKKADVDLSQMILTGGLKTDAGKDRIVPIHSRIAGLIKARYDMGRVYLIERNGRPVNDDTYRKRMYYPVLDALEIKRKSPHKARHTFFSRLDEATQDKKAMADIGGHSDPTFSEKVYVHPDIDRLRTAIESIQ